MRTYQSTPTKDKKKDKNKKIAYAIMLSLSVVAVAVIITLSLVLGRPTAPLQKPGDPDVPVITPPTPVYVVPMDDFTLGKTASLDRVVYSSSMNYWKTHNGIDFLGEAGDYVFAIRDGKVSSIQNTELESTIIAIEHDGGVVSYYKGLNKDTIVKVGDVVEAGDKIGTIAAVMPHERDEGAHLHLEIRLNKKLVDPMNYLPELGDK